MADGDTTPDGSGVAEQPVPPAPAASRPERATWKTLFAALPGHLAAGLTHLGQWAAHLGRWLAGLGRRLARIADVKPTPLQKLALLSGLAAASIFGALAFPANPVGQACVIAFVPGLCIAIGILGTRWHIGQGLNPQLLKATHSAVHTALQLRNSVRYVDDRLSAAQRHLEEAGSGDALIEVVRAKTATELTLGSAQYEPRQAESRAAGKGDVILGSIARVIDEHTVIINRGAEHGIATDMVFAVLAEDGDPIVDPETGDVIGELPADKFRVKVVDVQPKFSRAVAFGSLTPATVGYPALTAGSWEIGAFDLTDESISRMLETELGEQFPVRETIAGAQPDRTRHLPVRPEVTVGVGDRIRQVLH